MPATPEPPKETDDAARKGFGAAWDDYALRSRPAAGTWPGDEWGDPNLWSAWFRRLFEPFGVAKWQRAIEIGQGSGKYTERVLAAGNCELLALDVSEQFLSLCAKRLARFVESKRLHPRLIHERDPDPIRRAAADIGWLGTTDAVFSIDALVHVTLTQIAMLLLSATEVLRVGGCFIGTFANCASQSGLRKLVADVDRVVGGGGGPETGCFHWTTPEAIRSVAAFLGYEVALCEVDPEHGRDGLFVLRFADERKAEAARAMRVRTPGA